MIFGRTKVISRLSNGKWEYSRRYKVLGVDERSVVVVIYGKYQVKNPKKFPTLNRDRVKELSSKAVIHHIFFENECCWFLIGKGKNREFFRRLK